MDERARREDVRQFILYWQGEKGGEKQSDTSYWLSLLRAIFGSEDDYTQRMECQKTVIVNGHTKFIDIYIPETKVIIEQKSKDKALDKKYSQSGGESLTPYEQAKQYNNNLPSSEKARWIITSNFDEIWIYDMDKSVPEAEGNIVKISLGDLQSQYARLEFLLNKKVKQITREVQLSLDAGELVGKIYNSLYKEYYDRDSKSAQRSLNILCVRLVFCLYAEDALLFGKRQFSNYIRNKEPYEIRESLINIFKVLDTPKGEERERRYFSKNPQLNDFPYVNGGLFEEEIEIPAITEEIKEAILEASDFNWSEISPTIFGALFESTLNPVTRRKGGMHYTSIENIHRVIDPLFLDSLTEEAETVLTAGETRKLATFQNKLANLKFLDPACGSGNFLTETYLCIRRLENRIIFALTKGQNRLNFEESSWIKVSISQFYGIEINDFAVTVAKTALWIAESQMLKETEDILHSPIDFLPLKTFSNIVEGNALEIDWETVVSKKELSYIYGNPPFVGKSYRSSSQQKDMARVFKGVTGFGNLDYVACWYKVAADYIKDTKIECAFVSTNSLCQGIAVPPLWKYLLDKKAIINYAYRTFVWESEAISQAAVYCVIVGFSLVDRPIKKLFTVDSKDGTVKQITPNNINPYLVDGTDIIVIPTKKRLGQKPIMTVGSCPCDGKGNLLITTIEEKDRLISACPQLAPYIRPYFGGEEFINSSKNNDLKRFCLWLKDAPPSVLNHRAISSRLEAVRKIRLASIKEATQKKAATPHLFTEDRYVVSANPLVKPLFIPRTSSGGRNYIPIDFVERDVIISLEASFIPESDLYTFGILTSNVHMAWMRITCGYLGTSYRYSATAVYNTFPFPNPSEEQKKIIETTAQAILDVRQKYFDNDPDCSYATLYGRIMPSDLAKAHQNNDKAVMMAYGFDIKTTDEPKCVEYLMKMYQELTAIKKKLFNPKP